MSVPKPKGAFSRKLAPPLLFIVTLILTMVVADYVFGLALGSDYNRLIVIPDIELGFAHIPTAEVSQTSYYFAKGEPSDKPIENIYKVRINSLRFRGPEPATSDTNAFRIACLGDSNTFGWGEEEENIFPTLIEKTIYGRGAVRTYNLGVAGYTSYQGFLALKRYEKKLAPNLVTIAFGSNDARDVNVRSPLWAFSNKPDREAFGPDAHPTGKEKFTVRMFSLFAPVISRSAIVNWLGTRIKTRNINEDASLAKNIPRVSPDEFVRNIEAIIGEANAINASSLIIVLCNQDVYELRNREIAAKTGVPILVANEIYPANFDTLRSNPEFAALVSMIERRYGAETLAKHPELSFTNDGCHPNALGHRLIADALSKIIESMPIRKH